MASNIFLAITITFMYAAPLILTALGGVVSERSGVINIGLEGMMVIGAFAGAAAGYYSASPWIGFLAAGLAGGLLALLHAVASITFKANQTISGVALNFIGQGLALFLCRLFFDGATMSKPVPKQMPKLMSLLGLQPEDWLEMATPVNIPGTSTEYPNWRRKLSVTLEQMFADERVNKLIKDLDKRRKAASKKAAS